MFVFFSRLLKYFGVRKENKINNPVEKILTADKFSQLEKIIGFPIKNKSYYIQALMHRSFLEELESGDISNERMEFLGDSVLSLTAAEYLFEAFPNEDEGFLTKTRAKLVNRSALSDAAESIGLAKFILINQNLSNSFSKASKTVLSDAFEAIVGAIYLDNDICVARKFIRNVLIEPLIKEGEYLKDENYKSQLLEYAQAGAEVGLIGHQTGNPDLVKGLDRFERSDLVHGAAHPGMGLPPLLLTGDRVFRLVGEHVLHPEGEALCEGVAVFQRFRKMVGRIDEIHLLRGPHQVDEVEQVSRFGAERGSDQHLVFTEVGVEQVKALHGAKRGKRLVEEIHGWNAALIGLGFANPQLQGGRKMVVHGNEVVVRLQ